MLRWRLLDTLWPFFPKYHVRHASPLRPQTAVIKMHMHVRARAHTPRLHPVPAELLPLIKPTRSVWAKTARTGNKSAASCKKTSIFTAEHTSPMLYACQIYAWGGTITHYWSVISGSARAAAPIGPQPVGATSLICCVHPHWCPEIPAWASQLRIREGFLSFKSTFLFTSRWHPFEYLYGYNFMVDLHFITDMKWRRKGNKQKRQKPKVLCFRFFFSKVTIAEFKL